MNNLPKCLILDIGGTLTKLCFVAPEEMNVPHNPNLTSIFSMKLSKNRKLNHLLSFFQVN